MKNSDTSWEERYLKNNTPWDLGEISAPLKDYIDQITDKNIRILIPGAGNSHEAEYFYKKGFKNIYVADIALEPLKNLKSRFPKFPSENLLNKNFFDLTGKFDLILEQTFFCALPPKRRKDYVSKMNGLLTKNAKLVGLFFDFPLTQEGPPFGGNEEEYRKLFSKYFEIKTLQACYNSIKPRKGRELFFIFRKK